MILVFYDFFRFSRGRAVSVMMVKSAVGSGIVVRPGKLFLIVKRSSRSVSPSWSASPSGEFVPKCRIARSRSSWLIWLSPFASPGRSCAGRVYSWMSLPSPA